MATKMMHKSVKIYDEETMIAEYQVGKDDCVRIVAETNAVTIYFRSEEEPVQIHERPYRFYSGFRYIIEEL